MSKFHSKVHFYRKFMWGVSAWLFTLPLITVIAGASEEEARGGRGGPAEPQLNPAPSAPPD